MNPAVNRDLTVSQFLEIYVADHMLAKGLSYESSERWKLERVERMWGSQKLGEIQHADVMAFVLSLQRSTVQASTVRRYFARIRHMFGWAERHDYIQSTPIKKGLIELQPENNERSRRPTAEELHAILEAADPFLRDYLIVMLDTGLRRKSLLGLQFRQVRWEEGRNGVVSLPPRLLKQRKGQRIPLTRSARVVLARRFEQLGGLASGDAYVFGDAFGQKYMSPTPVVKRWNAALKAAGLKDPERGIDPDLQLRDLRGESASRLKDQRVPVSTIQQYLGHSSLAMTQRYLRPRVGELQEVADALERYAVQEEPTVKPTAGDSGENELSDSLRKYGGPPGDRTQDTVIKSHVLYH